MSIPKNITYALIFFLSINRLLSLQGEYKKYPLTNEPIDVVIACHEKDIRTLDAAIHGITQNGKGIRRVIVVSERKFTDLAEWFNEAQYPFTKKDLASEIFQDEKKAKHFVQSPSSRIGWIYQQLLKLYAPFVIPNISSNILILDADTIFLRPVEFIDQSGCALFNPGREHYITYFAHGKKVIPGFRRLYTRYSGISHHMLFQRPILEDMFNVIKENHGIEPWKALCKSIDVQHIDRSTMSEYELYFNFAFLQTDRVKLRILTWEELKTNFEKNKNYQKSYPTLDYVSLHLRLS